MFEVISLTTAVAVTLYNGERFIYEQLESLLNQTKAPDRVVLCDDGSKDQTAQIVKTYIDEHALADRWIFIRNEQNLGYIKNFYKAISLCGTDLIYLCDQDDIWKEDKIEKMTQVMQERPEISLLSCRYGIVDAQGVVQHSVVEKESREDGQIRCVDVQEIMRAYRWPGMLMCLRKTFFESICDKIRECDVAHDFMFAVLAADTNGFWEYNYVGAFHRRHDNNTAREEHRVSKLLNMERKLTDISITRKLWTNFLEADLPLQKTNRELMEKRLACLNEREAALKNKSLGGILKLYTGNSGKMLRLNSFLCDIWLVLFG